MLRHHQLIISALREADHADTRFYTFTRFTHGRRRLFSMTEPSRTKASPTTNA